MQMFAATQVVLPLDVLKARADAIRVTLKDLALAAGLNAGTPYRVLRSGGGMHVSTARGLTDALVAAERQVFEHLRHVHPEWAGEASEPAKAAA